MGCWGVGSFENDDAMDFLYEVEEQGLEAIGNTISLHLEEGESSEVGESFIAAAEIVAAVSGHDSKDLPDEAASLIENFSPDDVAQWVDPCLEGLHILLRPSSEMHALWAETESLKKWEKAVHDLIERLQN